MLANNFIQWCNLILKIHGKLREKKKERKNTEKILNLQIIRKLIL